MSAPKPVISNVFESSASDRLARFITEQGIAGKEVVPLTPDAFQTTLRGGRDAVAVRLSSDFSRLLYSSYFGGSGIEYGRGAAIGNGVFYFGGETTSPDFPKVAAPQASYGGNADAFVARLNPGQ